MYEHCSLRFKVSSVIIGLSILFKYPNAISTDEALQVGQVQPSWKCEEYKLIILSHVLCYAEVRGKN